MLSPASHHNSEIYKPDGPSSRAFGSSESPNGNTAWTTAMRVVMR